MFNKASTRYYKNLTVQLYVFGIPAYRLYGKKELLFNLKITNTCTNHVELIMNTSTRPKPTRVDV